MPRLTLYPNGIVAAPSRGTGNRAPSTRERITGWTAGSARRNDIFLRSVDYAAIEASGLHGWAATLTLRSAPATADEFTKRLRRFLKRLVDATAQLIHYVIEMQPRKNSPDGPVPHVHLVGFFPQDYGPHVMTPKGPLGGGIFFFVFWQDQFLDYEPVLHAQHFAPITDPGGWARYVAKHGARSEGHYQRLRGMLPAGWQNTGRVWGTLGDWPVRKDALHLSDRAFYALRRVVTRLQLADAHRSIAKLEARLADSGNAKQQVRNRRLLDKARDRIRYLQHRLRRRDPHIGRIVPVSDWLDPDQAHRWVLGACVPVEHIDRDTGEVSWTWVLKGEPVAARADRSQHLRATVPGGVTGCR